MCDCVRDAYRSITAICRKCYSCPYNVIKFNPRNESVKNRILELMYMIFNRSNQFTVDDVTLFINLEELINRILGENITISKIQRRQNRHHRHHRQNRRHRHHRHHRQNHYHIGAGQEIRLLLCSQFVQLQRLLTVREIRFLRFVFGRVRLSMKNINTDEISVDYLQLQNCRIQRTRTQMLNAVNCHISNAKSSMAEIKNSTIYFGRIGELSFDDQSKITADKTNLLMHFQNLKEMPLSHFFNFKPDDQTIRTLTRYEITSNSTAIPVLHVPRIRIDYLTPKQAMDLSRCSVSNLILLQSNLTKEEFRRTITSLANVGYLVIRLEEDSDYIDDKFIKLATGPFDRPWCICDINNSMTYRGFTIEVGSSEFIDIPAAQYRQTVISNAIGSGIIDDLKNIIYHYLAIHENI